MSEEKKEDTNSTENAENSEKADSPDSSKEASAESTEKNDALEMKAQIEKLQSDMLYLKADFENYKKRMIKERSDIIKYGSENMVVALLDLLDNFERAMSMELTAENVQSFSDGINMIANEFKSVLNRFGVSEVKALGETFNPSFHEAMGTEPTDQYSPGTISKVFTKPYKLHDRLVRPGRVIVAEEPKKDEGSAS